MRNQTPAQVEREKPICTGEKITGKHDERTRQESKSGHMNESGMPQPKE